MADETDLGIIILTIGIAGYSDNYELYNNIISPKIKF